MVASLRDGSETDTYIPTGRIGEADLKNGCYSFAEVLRLAAAELACKGEAESTRQLLKAGGQTVRGFLHRRFGIVTGVREYFTPSHRTPDGADLREFLGALRIRRSCQS